MTTKFVDKFILALGILLMVAAFFIFSTGKREDQNFKNIIAQLKFLQNSVQTKMAGSVAWFTGEEEEKINAYGLGLTSSESAAHYLYLDKIQIISLDDSLIEFLPEDELKLNKGSALVLNPDGVLKMSDKNGSSAIVEKGMLYTSTDKGLVTTPVKWEKIWVPQGNSYEIVYQDGVIQEKFLLAPPMLTIDLVGTACVGRILPINGDFGDVSYQVRSSGQKLQLAGMEVKLPSSKSVIEISSLVNGVNSAWREIQLPLYCVTEEEVLAPIEDLQFFAISREQIFIDDAESPHRVLVYFNIDGSGDFKITGPNLNRAANITGQFKREYLLSPGIYSFSLKKGIATYNRIIEVKVKPPFKLNDSIFIED